MFWLLNLSKNDVLGGINLNIVLVFSEFLVLLFVLILLNIGMLVMCIVLFKLIIVLLIKLKLLLVVIVELVFKFLMCIGVLSVIVG